MEAIQDHWPWGRRWRWNVKGHGQDSKGDEKRKKITKRKELVKRDRDHHKWLFHVSVLETKTNKSLPCRAWVCIMWLRYSVAGKLSPLPNSITSTPWSDTCTQQAHMLRPKQSVSLAPLDLWFVVPAFPQTSSSFSTTVKFLYFTEGEQGGVRDCPVEVYEACC